MNKYVVSSNNFTAEQQNAVTEFFQKQGWEQWHWYDSLWLLKNVPSTWSPKKLYEALESEPRLQGANIVVLAVNEPITFWGRAPEEAWPWMSDWARPG